MKIPIFTGSSVAIVTPFRDGKIDYNKLAELIEFQIDGGTSAIVICGTTGESSTQSLEEHVEAVSFCVKTVAGRIPVVAGSGSNDTEAALFLARKAEASGADGLLVVTPYYNKATQRGLVRHFTYIADRVNTPIILYNVPSRTGCGFTAETYRELAGHPMINGVKEASGDFSLFAKTRALCGDELNVWSGNDDHTVPMMSMGAKGLVSVAANILPKPVAEMCRLALAGDFGKATELQLRYLDIMNTLFIEVSPIPVKTALNLMGMDAGELRLPLCEMTPEHIEALAESMTGAGLTLR